MKAGKKQCDMPMMGGKKGGKMDKQPMTPKGKRMTGKMGKGKRGGK